MKDNKEIKRLTDELEAMHELYQHTIEQRNIAEGRVLDLRKELTEVYDRLQAANDRTTEVRV